VENKDTYLNSFGGCHVDILYVVNSKFDGKDKPKFFKVRGPNRTLK